MRCVPDSIAGPWDPGQTTRRDIDIYTWQPRLFPNLPLSHEYGDRGFYLYNKLTGRYDVAVWAPVSNTQSFGVFLGPTTELHVDDWRQINATYYTVAVWYRWWVWNQQTASWNQQTDWVVHPTMCDTLTPYFSLPISFDSGSETAARPTTPAVAVRRLQGLLRQERLPIARFMSGERQPTANRATCFGRHATIVGTEEGETIEGTGRRDVIAARGGDDLVIGLGGPDLICGGGGADRIRDGKGRNKISGDRGDDVILAGRGADIVRTGPGLDIVEGRAGADTFYGDAQDAVAFLYSPSGVVANLRTQTAADGWGSTDTLEGFKTVVGSTHDDHLVGSPGKDWFVPMAGDDIIAGSSGVDVLAFLLATQGIDADLSAGVAFGEGTDSFKGIDVVFGGEHDDSLTGDEGYSWLFGGVGDDILDGVAGEDTLDGGPGDDECTQGGYYGACENQGEGVIAATLPEPEEGDPPPNP